MLCNNVYVESLPKKKCTYLHEEVYIKGLDVHPKWNTLFFHVTNLKSQIFEQSQPFLLTWKNQILVWAIRCLLDVTIKVGKLSY